MAAVDGRDAFVPAVGGCAIAPAPLKDPPHIVATPVNGQLSISSEPRSLVVRIMPFLIDYVIALPNRRLKLAAPFFCSSLLFVKSSSRRRSLGASR